MQKYLPQHHHHDFEREEIGPNNSGTTAIMVTLTFCRFYCFNQHSKGKLFEIFRFQVNKECQCGYEGPLKMMSKGIMFK